VSSNAEDLTPRRPGAPREWLDGWANWLESEVLPATVTGATAGKGWLSLRLEREFLWLVARGADRMVWLSPSPFDRRRLAVLGQRASPLTDAVLGRRIESVAVLANAAGEAEGIQLQLDRTSDRWPQLSWRGWPRPGAIWIADAQGRPRAQEGRMEGEALTLREAQPGMATFDVAEHRRNCEERWTRVLSDEVAHRVGRALRQREKAMARKFEHLREDLGDPSEIRAWRGDADLLAANLHRVERGASLVECVDFEGRPKSLSLDPRLRPHQNLDRLYRRVQRAEVRQQRVTEYLESLEREQEQHRARFDQFSQLPPAHEDLDAWLDAAREWGIEIVPAPDPRSESAKPRRVPFWAYLLDGQWELRVGRSARDNDSMLREHRAGRDLWFHAQGVTGSHVILRRGDREVPRPVLEAAAQLAAHFSKARTSETVAVIHTERRYVRKPRKAAPGLVTVEREQTLFVRPAIPENCRKVDA
jgi:NFACT N-terminal and middle domains/NFACT protein RNA binding domain